MLLEEGGLSPRGPGFWVLILSCTMLRDLGEADAPCFWFAICRWKMMATRCWMLKLEAQRPGLARTFPVAGFLHILFLI